jgi:hypothetical protein
MGTASLIMEMLGKTIPVINCILIKHTYSQEIIMSIIWQYLWTNQKSVYHILHSPSVKRRFPVEFQITSNIHFLVESIIKVTNSIRDMHTLQTIILFCYWIFLKLRGGISYAIHGNVTSSGLKNKTTKKPAWRMWQEEVCWRWTWHIPPKCQRTARCYVPETRTTHNHSWETLKSYIK